MSEHFQNRLIVVIQENESMVPKGKGRRVNREELAEIFGVSLNTVTAWIRNGCPYEQRGRQGRPWRLNTADVSEWLEEYARSQASPGPSESEQDLKLRKLHADVLLLEGNLRRNMQAVAPVEELERAWSLQVKAIRHHLLESAKRVVPQLAGETNEARFKVILNAELVEALQKAADADIELTEDSETPD